MNENVNLMMKHMLRLAEAYEKSFPRKPIRGLSLYIQPQETRLRNTIVIVLLRAWISHGWKTLKHGWQRR